MLIKINNFLGIGPLIHPKLLPENMATDAIDCFVTTGAITPVYEPISVTSSHLPTPAQAPDGVKTIYKFGLDETAEANYWLSFTEDTDVVRGQVAGDTQERTYFTNSTGMRSINFSQAISGTGTYPASSSDLTAFVAPTASPAATVQNKTISRLTLDGSSVIRVVFNSKHGLSKDATSYPDVTIYNADQTEWLLTVSITRVVDEYTVESEQNVGELSSVEATGAVKAYVYKDAYGSAPMPITAYAYDSSSGYLTVQIVNHGLQVGDLFTLTGMPVNTFNSVDAVVYTVIDEHNVTIQSLIGVVESVAATAISGVAYRGKQYSLYGAAQVAKLAAETTAPHGLSEKTTIHLPSDAGDLKAGYYVVTPKERGAAATITAFTYNAATGKVVLTITDSPFSTGQFVDVEGLPYSELNVSNKVVTRENDGTLSYVIDSALTHISSAATAGQVFDALPSKQVTFETKGVVSNAENQTYVAENVEYNLSTLNFPPESRTYIYTFVVKDSASGIERESPPSTPTGLLEVLPGQKVELQMNSELPTLAGEETLWYRIYRTVGGSSAATFYYVDEVQTTTYVDAVETTDLGEPCPAIDYAPPPAGLSGLTNLPNGMMAGFVGRDVYFCEPYRPHTWPETYTLTVDYPVVGLGAFQNTLVVLTTGYPYVAIGADPSSMMLQKVNLFQSCVSKRSIVSVGHGVMYASPNGIAYVGSQGAQLLTGALFNKVTWENYVGDPSTIHAYNYDGVYVGFYGTMGGTHGGFMFDIRNQKQAFTKLSSWFTAGHFNPKNGNLYLVYQPNTSTQASVVRFHGIPTPPATPTAKTFTWISKLFEVPKPINISTAQVLCDAYPVTFTVLTDAGSNSYTVTSQRAFKLHSGFRSRNWKFAVTGTNPVQSIFVATSGTELQNG